MLRKSILTVNLNFKLMISNEEIFDREEYFDKLLSYPEI